MDFDTLKAHSKRLNTLENNFQKFLSEIQNLRREVDLALLEMQNTRTDPPDPIRSTRSDSPLIFQPLTPAPRPRRVRSSAVLSKVWTAFQSRVSHPLTY
jgi:hypothetical protein